MDDQDTVMVIHNDAVVEGVSEAPLIGDGERWRVLTIGTELGDAHVTSHRPTGN
jgi:hypothetical protein